MKKTQPYYEHAEVAKEIEAVFAKRKLAKNLTDKERLIAQLTYFYEFIRKDTRLKIIRDLYDYLNELSFKYKFSENHYRTNDEIEPLFRRIANQLYKTSPDQHSIEFMIREYIKIIESENKELSQRILSEIYNLTFQVNKMTHLYYNGDGKGRVVYVHLYSKD
jgi:hypothetical protein